MQNSGNCLLKVSVWLRLCCFENKMSFFLYKESVDFVLLSIQVVTNSGRCSMCVIESDIQVLEFCSHINTPPEM
jgi:hypothetical protein